MNDNQPDSVQELAGGINAVTKVGATVHRPTGPWSASVHRLLKHIRENGFLLAPEFLGTDDKGNEILSFIEGEVSGYPMSNTARSISVLTSASQVLRAFHDANQNFVTTSQDVWQLPAQEPREVICHGDYGPHNCVIRDDIVIGVIDFDIAHPGPRIWDVAYAIYRFAPLTAPTNSDGFGSIEEQAERMRVFCKSYGLEHRETLIDTVIARLSAMASSITRQAEAGNAAYQQHVEAGHVQLYLNDQRYIAENRDYFMKMLL